MTAGMSRGSGQVPFGDCGGQGCPGGQAGQFGGPDGVQDGQVIGAGQGAVLVLGGG
jgi:hypothetical protein